MPRVDDSHFIEWMRPPVHSSFSKLYAVIHHDLEPGVYTVAINNSESPFHSPHSLSCSGLAYPMRVFGGNKRVALASPNWIGRPNKALGGVYLAVGVFQFVVAIGFLIKDRFYRR